MKIATEMVREASDPDKVDPWRNGFWVLTQEELERFAELVRADERNRLADKLQQDFKGAFGDDTCASWASWIRGQK